MFDRFRTLSQSQQLLLVLGLVGLCCAIFLGVWFAFLRTPYLPLFTELRPADAASIVAELDRKKVPYRLSDGGATIAVPADRVDATRLNMMTGDVPLKGTVGFELFNKSDMGLTDFAQKINYLRAIQGELERTIMTLHGIAAARVHIAMGEDRVFRDDQVPPKASVTVLTAKGAKLDTDTVQGIQRMVAAAIPKLEMSNVVVLDENGRVVSAEASPQQFGRALAPFLQEKQAISEFYQARIQAALAQAYPQEHVDVQVSPEIRVPATGELYQWNPAARDFALTVKLLLAPGSDIPQGDLLQIVNGSIGVAQGQRDTVSFGTLVAEDVAVSVPPKATPHSVSRAWPSQEQKADERDWYWDLLFAVIPLAVLVALWALLRQARGPRPLSEEERARFATQLRQALERKADHAPSAS